MQTINPDYKKPPDYNEPTIKITDKVMIPQVLKLETDSDLMMYLLLCRRITRVSTLWDCSSGPEAIL